MILQPSSWLGGVRSRCQPPIRRVMAPGWRHPHPTISDWRLADSGEAHELRRITSRFACSSAPRVSCLCSCTAQSRSTHFATPLAICHHRQRKRRASGRRTDRSLRSDQRRHSSVGRRKSRQTPTSHVAAGSHSQECRARFPGVPRDHAVRRGRRPAGFEPCRAIEDSVPAVRHELRTEHHALPYRDR